MIDLQNELTAISLMAADSKAASANGTGVDISDYIGKLKLTLDCEIGTSGDTLDVKVQDSPDDSTYTDVSGATFTQVTDAALAFESIGLDTRAVEKYIRVVATIAGSGPVFVFSVSAVGRKQVI